MKNTENYFLTVEQARDKIAQLILKEKNGRKKTTV